MPDQPDSGAYGPVADRCTSMLVAYGGTAPCGATFGTAAGPNDGTR